MSHSTDVKKPLAHSLEGIKKILIFNGDGQVKITADKNSSKLKGSYTVRMAGNSSQVNTHINNEMTIYAKTDKQKLTLKFGYDNKTKKSNKKAKVDIELLVPKDVFIDLRSNNGDITLANLGKGGRIINKKGKITLNNIQGTMTINDGSGDIDVNRGNGKLKINDSKGHIAVNDHHGSLIINDKSGHISIQNNQGQVKVSDSTGDININKNIGFIKVTNKADDVTIKGNKGNVYVKSASGTVTITDIKGNVKFKNKENVKLKTNNISGKIEV